MGGHGSHPLAWTVLALVVVAYAHVILELACAGLALAIATRVVTRASAWMLVDRLMPGNARRKRGGRSAIAAQASRSAAPVTGRGVDRAGDRD
jgi:hypothetical protein